MSDAKRIAESRLRRTELDTAQAEAERLRGENAMLRVTRKHYIYIGDGGIDPITDWCGIERDEEELIGEVECLSKDNKLLRAEVRRQNATALSYTDGYYCGSLEGDCLIRVDANGNALDPAHPHTGELCMEKVFGLEGTIRHAQDNYVNDTDSLKDSIADLEAEIVRFRDENEELQTQVDSQGWERLLEILDKHYPESNFPTTRELEEPDRDEGPRLVALSRWVGELRAQLVAMTGENEELRESLKRQDWQNQPNRNPAGRGAFEFYIGEFWEDVGQLANDVDASRTMCLTKHRRDPDDERVRIRRVKDDDALLLEANQLAAMTEDRDELREIQQECTDGQKEIDEFHFALMTKRDAAVTAFEDYGWHLRGCPKHQNAFDERPCDCGYNKTKEAINKGGETKNGND